MPAPTPAPTAITANVCRCWAAPCHCSPMAARLTLLSRTTCACSAFSQRGAEVERARPARCSTRSARWRRRGRRRRGPRPPPRLVVPDPEGRAVGHPAHEVHHLLGDGRAAGGRRRLRGSRPPAARARRSTTRGCCSRRCRRRLPVPAWSDTSYSEAERPGSPTRWPTSVDQAELGEALDRGEHRRPGQVARQRDLRPAHGLALRPAGWDNTFWALDRPAPGPICAQPLDVAHGR